jgi:hypothetical protein
MTYRRLLECSLQGILEGGNLLSGQKCDDHLLKIQQYRNNKKNNNIATFCLVEKYLLRFTASDYFFCMLKLFK